MVDAQSLTSELGGHWYGAYGLTHCPVCQSEARRDQAALSVRDGNGAGLLLYCHKAGCDFLDILAAAGPRSGGWTSPNPLKAREAEAASKAEIAAKKRKAEKLWRGALPIGGTLAERYLRGRGIICQLPPTLSFHPSCWHPSGRAFPAMIAKVEGVEGTAIHRTYLREDGTGKADADPAKLMLAPTRGGAVRLSSGVELLAVAEGIETGLSLLCGLLDFPATVWAALSAPNMEALRLPDRAGQLVIAADGDKRGREAAHNLATRAHGLGWAVSIMTAPAGWDFNDLLSRKAVAA